MRYETISQGYVQANQPQQDRPVRMGPRCVKLRDGRLLCSFNTSSSLGVNDFVPALAESTDGGETWHDRGMIWPSLINDWSIFASISHGRDGELCLFGSRYVIDEPGEPNWNDALQGLKANELIWARSTDEGRTWSDPMVIPMPIAGSSEAPGPMTVTRDGRRLVCYAPYNTFDPNLKVDRSQVVLLYSDDDGKTWQHNSMLRFAEKQSGAAEQWVVELADGRLLGTSWHINHAPGGAELPNKYAISHDRGTTWTPTRSTGILGHTTALTPLPDGRCLFCYVQRKQSPVGICVAVVAPTDDDFGIQHNAPIWITPKPTRSGGAADHDKWQDYTFGEPALTLLDPRTVLATYWHLNDTKTKEGGASYVKYRMVD